jgi:hypothetical protein
LDGKVTLRNPTKKLLDYLAIGNVYFETDDIFGLGDAEEKIDSTGERDSTEDNLANKKTNVKGVDIFGNNKNEDKEQVENVPKTENNVQPVVNTSVAQNVNQPSQPVVSAPVQAVPKVDNVVPQNNVGVVPQQTNLSQRPVITPITVQPRVSIVPNNLNVVSAAETNNG